MKSAVSRSPTDAELKEYMEVVDMIKKLEARKNELKEICIERGSFCSKNFVCSITDQTRTGLAGLEFVEKALGREILNYHNLIRTSTFKVVRVSPIGKMFKLA